LSLPKNKNEYLIEGLRDLKDASLYLLISSLIAVFGVFPLIGALFTGLTGFAAALITLTVFIVIILVAVVLSIIAVYVKLLSSVRLLKEYDPGRYSSASTLIRIGYVWGLMLALIGLVTAILVIVSPIFIFIGLGVTIVGAILLLIGFIGLIILSFKLHDEFRKDSFLVAAILFIVSIFLSGLLTFIAWIFMYLGAKDSLNELLLSEGSS